MNQKELDAHWTNIINGLKYINDRERRRAMKNLLTDFRHNMMSKPASIKHHHAFAGGLAVHTSQVIRYAMELYKSNKALMRHIIQENVYISAVLHDISKCVQYTVNCDPSFPYAFRHDERMNIEPDIWSLATAERYGIKLNYYEMMGIVQAHGGWSKLNTPIEKLSVIIHCADMLSSQLKEE